VRAISDRYWEEAEAANLRSGTTPLIGINRYIIVATGCGFLKAGEFGLSRLGPWIPEIGGKMRPEKLSDPRKPRLRRNCITSADFWPF
jgi:hypothetical protein